MHDQTAEPREPREASRVLVRDGNGLVLLFEVADPAEPDARFWVTPGGGRDEGETFEEAAHRELREEAGFEIADLGAPVRDDAVEFRFDGVVYEQRQRFYAVEVPGDGSLTEPDINQWTEYERRTTTAWRWWSLDELQATADVVYPADLVGLIGAVTAWGSARPIARPGDHRQVWL